MVASAYHLFKDIYDRKANLTQIGSLEQLSFRDELVAWQGISKGTFPDMVLKTNRDNDHFIGGEFIEMKDSKSGYNITSFNSTISFM